MVRQLRVEVAELRAQNAELRRRLDQDSSNSSRPPSSDSLFVRPAPRSLRGRSGRKPGGQTGHEGRALRQVEAPDQVEWHEPVACGGCGAGLPASAGMASVVCRQVFDIPAIRVRVTEHRLVERRCHCGSSPVLRRRPGCGHPPSTGRTRRRSACTCIRGSSCLGSAPLTLCRNCSPRRCRRAQCLPGRLAQPMRWAAVGSPIVSGLRWPRRPWRTSTRPGCGWRAVCTGCIRRRPASIR